MFEKLLFDEKVPPQVKRYQRKFTIETDSKIGIALTLKVPHDKVQWMGK